jgi:p-hydroxybenzoate 3-monooxygenase
LSNGVEIRFNGRGHRIDFSDLTGRSIMIYTQQEVVQDLIAARLNDGGQTFFEVSDVSVHDFDSAHLKIRFQENGQPREILCDFIAGCDGFHGVCRPSVSANRLTIYERVFHSLGWASWRQRRLRPRN